ncbi:MAG: homoserine kinase [Aquabacterium sp.]
MAVFTEVSFHEAAGLLSVLHLGTLQSMQGATSGIENTNYFVTTDQGEFVLTLFERLRHEQLPFYLNLMHHLARRGIPVPAPQADARGAILHTLKGKPAAVVTKLKGRNQLAPQAADCAQVGAMLARMHEAGQDYAHEQPNLRGLSWWIDTIPVVRPHLGAEQGELIETELAFQMALADSASYKALPRGPIHADLFRDNVMFDGPVLSGFFDFYFAGCDTLCFDIAVCLNDWCIDLATGAIDAERAQAFVAAYDAQRRLTDDELVLLPSLMRSAALRFWTSRLWDFYLPRDAAMLKPHDPTHFERVLRLRRTAPWSYQRAAAA